MLTFRARAGGRPGSARVLARGAWPMQPRV